MVNDHSTFEPEALAECSICQALSTTPVDHLPDLPRAGMWNWEIQHPVAGCIQAFRAYNTSSIP